MTFDSNGKCERRFCSTTEYSGTDYKTETDSTHEMCYKITLPFNGREATLALEGTEETNVFEVYFDKDENGHYSIERIVGEKGQRPYFPIGET